METYQSLFTIDAISILGTTHPVPNYPKTFLLKYDHDDGVLQEYHMNQFMIALSLMNVENEDVF